VLIRCLRLLPIGPDHAGRTLLAKNKNPLRDEIVEHMNGNICRCGTYLKIISAIQRAAREG